jgi:four helix bundle protein
MLHELKIFQKTYDLIIYLHPVVNKFPKAEKFVLGQRIENTALNVLEGIIAANQETDKEEILKKTGVELEKLRMFIRLAKDLKFISIGQYEHTSLMVNEIGKMLGGLMKKFTPISQSSLLDRG